MVPFVMSIMWDHVRMIHTVLMRKYFFRHIAEESERKLEMSSMELHKEFWDILLGNCISFVLY
jgi:hypothetical protein